MCENVNNWSLGGGRRGLGEGEWREAYRCGIKQLGKCLSRDLSVAFTGILKQFFVYLSLDLEN